MFFMAKHNIFNGVKKMSNQTTEDIIKAGQDREDEHKGWGGMFFICGVVAMITLGLAVFVEGMPGKILSGTLFTIAVVVLLFWSGLNRPPKSTQQQN